MLCQLGKDLGQFFTHGCCVQFSYITMSHMKQLSTEPSLHHSPPLSLGISWEAPFKTEWMFSHTRLQGAWNRTVKTSCPIIQLENRRGNELETVAEHNSHHREGAFHLKQSQFHVGCLQLGSILLQSLFYQCINLICLKWILNCAAWPHLASATL